MARPMKEGLEYFPLDTDIDQDEKLVVVVAKYGMRGFGVIIRLMMEIYKSGGYFMPWTEKEHYVLSMKLKEDAGYILEVVNECLRWGFFHKTLFDTYGILTSKGFQKRYLLAAYRRKKASVREEYSLLDEDNGVSADIFDENDSNNSAADDELPSETPQSKVNKSKVNKKRYMDYVHMQEKEYQKLIERFGEEKTKRMIEILSHYKGSKGKMYKSDYHAILTWVADKVEEEFNRKQPNTRTERIAKATDYDYQMALDKHLREGGDIADFRYKPK